MAAYSEYFAFLSRSPWETRQAVSFFSKSFSNLFFCSFWSISSRSFTRIVPPSVNCFSNASIEWNAVSISFSLVLFSNRSIKTFLYQLPSKIAIRPASGVFVQNLHRNGCIRSSSVSALIGNTWNPLGSILWISFPIWTPFPDAPKPSKTIITGIFSSLHSLCNLPSSISICGIFALYSSLEIFFVKSTFSSIASSFKFIRTVPILSLL